MKRPLGGKPLAAAVGARVRELREKAGLRQEELARAARRLGFASWTRASVGALETGQRDITAAELLMLPQMLNMAGGDSPPGKTSRCPLVDLPDLIPRRGWVRVARDARVRAEALRAIASGRTRRVRLRDIDSPGLRHRGAQDQQFAKGFRRRLEELENLAAVVWPDATRSDRFNAVNESAGETEQRLARILHIPPHALALAARRRWKRSLSEERDRRVAATTRLHATAAQIRTVRGHVTRTLVAELLEHRGLADLCGRHRPAAPSSRRIRPGGEVPGREPAAAAPAQPLDGYAVKRRIRASGRLPAAGRTDGGTDA